MANKTQTKQNQVNAEALQLQGYQDSLRQQLPNAAKKSNTMLYVWIGVGVLAVGVLGFVLYKQYKK
jgi:LPXTG-motif cell wall-anchored protein